MKKVAVILANGFEEIEATTIIDVLRRAGLEAKFVGLDADLLTGAHGVKIYADTVLDKISQSDFDMIVLPGGLPGAEHLAKSAKLQALLKEFDAKGKFIGAICAAPMALATSGVIKENYTCYPGFETNVKDSGYISSQNVVKDGNIITSRGPATAMEFALELVKNLCGEQIYKEVKEGLLFVK
ncbi:DJ-1 family glyoxalase III [Campylobacter sp.]|uniref:DJ-1 family glyoxalase III n=1 Tax=Campylobacter sp. TaxID=205 RepID=UPI0027069523|nr:DJ-1/PfpI family protein [Campylobacter sp.]